VDTILNSVEYEYNDLGDVTELWQDRNGPVDRLGGSSDSALVEHIYDIQSASSGANRSRLSSLKYPSGAQFGYDYGTSGGVDDVIGRVQALAIADESPWNLVEYDYLSTATPVVIDFPQPDVRLDRSLPHNGDATDGVYPAYDRFGRVAKQMWVGSFFGPADPVQPYPAAPSYVELDYQYDRAGNRTQRYDGREGAVRSDRHEEFAYDGLNRVTEASRGVRIDSGTFAFDASSEQWSLDALGNWTSYETDSDASGVFQTHEDRSHNFANEATARDTDGDGSDDVTLAYDDAGNLRTRTAGAQVTTYTHDAWNRLVRVQVGTGSPSDDVYGEYEYNGLHWRTVRRAVEEPTFIIDFDRQRYYLYSAEWSILEEHADDDFDGTVEQWSESFWGLRGTDDIIRRRINSDLSNDSPEITYEESYWHLTDPSFSTMAVVDDAGAVVERVRYDALPGAARRPFNDVDGDGDYDSDDRDIIVALGVPVARFGPSCLRRFVVPSLPQRSPVGSRLNSPSCLPGACLRRPRSPARLCSAGSYNRPPVNAAPALRADEPVEPPCLPFRCPHATFPSSPTSTTARARSPTGCFRPPRPSPSGTSTTCCSMTWTWSASGASPSRPPQSR